MRTAGRRSRRKNEPSSCPFVGPEEPGKEGMVGAIIRDYCEAYDMHAGSGILINLAVLS